MIMHYGYSDGSGEYYITVDTDKCNGCGKCTQKCPQKALKLETAFVDLEDKTVVAVSEDRRREIKYTCASCQNGKGKTPCVLACEAAAIKCTWKI